jgi:hypothetical protein
MTDEQSEGVAHSGAVTDHQVKCFNPRCDAIFDSVQEMFAIGGRGERSARHFCEDCFDKIREEFDE